jgi:hypothetical protein
VISVSSRAFVHLCTGDFFLTVKSKKHSQHYNEILGLANLARTLLPSSSQTSESGTVSEREMETLGSANFNPNAASDNPQYLFGLESQPIQTQHCTSQHTYSVLLDARHLVDVPLQCGDTLVHAALRIAREGPQPHEVLVQYLKRFAVPWVPNNQATFL